MRGVETQSQSKSKKSKGREWRHMVLWEYDSTNFNTHSQVTISWDCATVSPIIFLTIPKFSENL